MNRRQVEYNRLRTEREDRTAQIITERKQEREAKRKMLFYLRSEEERQIKLREEEEARKREGIFIVFYSRDLIIQSVILFV